LKIQDSFSLNPFSETKPEENLSKVESAAPIKLDEKTSEMLREQQRQSLEQKKERLKEEMRFV